jgi:hypothetical protein
MQRDIREFIWQANLVFFRGVKMQPHPKFRICAHKYAEAPRSGRALSLTCLGELTENGDDVRIGAALTPSRP